MKRFRNGQGGFTLMELMVVIVIVAILAAVAVPLYINYVNDARDTEAKGAIGAVVTAQQAHHQQAGSYVTTTLVRNPVTGDPTVQDGLSCDVTDALNNWDIATAIDGAGFTVTAEGKGTANGPKAGHKVIYTYTPGSPGGWSYSDLP
jgi:prepilin-type N-terminal cleavage/methylation domain-containing protein